jgi:hypothetical protein
VPAVLAVSAVLLAFAPRYRSPAFAPAPVPAWATDTTPVREPPLRPLYKLSLFPDPLWCSECHRTQPVTRAAGADLTRHPEIHLSHGINDRCLNCHHPTNREAFVDYSGGEIPWDQPQRLCAQCHGPVYRDWQHGSHGRINGYWDTAQGPLVRLKCIECHDPHHPPFQPLASAPPPGTLHGKPPQFSAHSGERNPLKLDENAPANDHAAASGEGPK